MKKLAIFSTSLLSSAVMAAMPVNQPVGSSFTLSSAPNIRALSTVHGNPAAPFLMVNQDDNDSFRFGILGPLSIGVEMGDVSNLGDQIEQIEDILDATYVDANAAQAELNRANNIIDKIGDTAYIKTTASMQVPFMPIIYKTDSKGAFMLDASLSGVAKGSLLADNVVRSGNELTTDTSFYAQTATDLKLGLGYSQSVWDNAHGILVGGVKANLHNISMGRALVKLDDDSVDAGDAISDSISDDAVSSTGVGLDLGVVWVSNYYQVGLTLANINEPEFDGAPITSNAASNKYNISTTDKYVKEMQTTVDFAVSTKGKQVTLGLSYDANEVKDAVGDEYQWAAASLSYNGDSHFIPGLRVGFRQNMAGSELSYASAGLTILKRLNIDLAVALDTVVDEDGDELPRGGFFSIGYDTAF